MGFTKKKLKAKLSIIVQKRRLVATISVFIVAIKSNFKNHLIRSFARVCYTTRGSLRSPKNLECENLLVDPKERARGPGRGFSVRSMLVLRSSRFFVSSVNFLVLACSVACCLACCIELAIRESAMNLESSRPWFFFL